jgi:anti-sigma factor RsiW
MDGRAMRDSEIHLADEQLLLAAERELSPHREAEVAAHLSECAECRARAEKLASVVSDFGRVHREALDAGLPAVAPAREMLRARMAEQRVGSPVTRWREWFGGFFVGPRWVYAAAALLIAALGLRMLPRELAPADSRTEFAASDGGPLLPEARLTPGATRPISTSQACTPGPSDQMATIPLAVRRAVFHEYGMDGSQPRAYEVDHLITPELGGTDDIRNLWPEPYASAEWNARVKDELENRLRQMVCDGKVDLPTAQRDIASNWIAAYQKYFHTEKPISGESSVVWAREFRPDAEMWAELMPIPMELTAAH